MTLSWGQKWGSRMDERAAHILLLPDVHHGSIIAPTHNTNTNLNNTVCSCHSHASHSFERC